jgi:transposase-like protein
MRFFEKAILANGLPEKVTMDKSGANKSAIDQIVEDKDIAVEVRQIRYPNNTVEQDHRAQPPATSYVSDCTVALRSSFPQPTSAPFSEVMVALMAT